MDESGRGPAPSIAVIEKLAEVEGGGPAELEPPLATVIDTDALDHLFATRPETTGRLSFQFREYVVTVTSDGDVTVQDVSRPPE